MTAKFHAGFTFVAVRGEVMVVTGRRCAEVRNFGNTVESRLHVHAVQAG